MCTYVVGFCDRRNIIVTLIMEESYLIWLSPLCFKTLWFCHVLFRLCCSVLYRVLTCGSNASYNLTSEDKKICISRGKVENFPTIDHMWFFFFWKKTTCDYRLDHLNLSYIFHTTTLLLLLLLPLHYPSLFPTTINIITITFTNDFQYGCPKLDWNKK